MGTASLTTSHKVKQLGDKSLLNEEMLPFFKRPFAISCCRSYLILIRENLVESIAKLEDGKITNLKQFAVLNLLRIYQANIDCMATIRANLKRILPESEFRAILALQQESLEEIKLFDGQAEKNDEDLSETEIL